LLALDLHPNPSGIEERAFPADLAPQSFVGVPPDPPVSTVAKAKQMATNRWPTGGAITLDVAPSFTDPVADQSFIQPVGFETTVLLDDSELLELPPTPIDFPAEDSDLVVLARGRQNGTAPAHEGTELEPEAPETTTEDNSPRASLDALSRLHQELAEHEAIAIRFFTSGNADSLEEQILLALNSPDDLRAMAWRNYSAGIAISMPYIVRDYIQSFRQHERVKVLQLAASLRRSGRFRRADDLARTVGETIQKWQDEDEVTSPFA